MTEFLFTDPKIDLSVLLDEVVELLEEAGGLIKRHKLTEEIDGHIKRACVILPKVAHMHRVLNDVRKANIPGVEADMSRLAGEIARLRLEFNACIEAVEVRLGEINREEAKAA